MLPRLPLHTCTQTALEAEYLEQTARAKHYTHVAVAGATTLIHSGITLAHLHVPNCSQALLSLPFLLALLCVVISTPSIRLRNSALAIFIASAQLFRGLYHDAFIIEQLGGKTAGHALLGLVIGRSISTLTDLWLLRYIQRHVHVYVHTCTNVARTHWTLLSSLPHASNSISRLPLFPFAPLLIAAFLTAQLKIDLKIHQRSQGGLMWLSPMQGLAVNIALSTAYLYSERAKRRAFHNARALRALSDSVSGAKKTK